ncbi:hypothetical protein ACFQ1E_18160 [Sphingomonas canadensis]|uniref:Uncharacterized protein n=1 Tax=Sphingomonas canadensis TaxID=1219257 RepID=A0ABW3HB35_9SPHN|nr:hypothetical protein [Sphingomonas canadensis]MCW3837934.1 hypothetical protein [Sphingomonas canadensis]
MRPTAISGGPSAKDAAACPAGWTHHAFAVTYAPDKRNRGTAAMRIFTGVLVAPLLAAAMPAHAQRTTGWFDVKKLDALMTDSLNAYERGDDARGDEFCVELRDAIDGPGYFESSNSERYFRSFIEKHCGSDAPSAPPSPQQSRSPFRTADGGTPGSEFNPSDYVPTHVTGNARFVWSTLASANFLITIRNADLPGTDPARVANFTRARTQCDSIYVAFASPSLPGSEALLKTCSAFAAIVLNDATGCVTLRAAYPGLSDPAALAGVFGELLPAYRAAAKDILEGGACKGR